MICRSRRRDNARGFYVTTRIGVFCNKISRVSTPDVRSEKRSIDFYLYWLGV